LAAFASGFLLYLACAGKTSLAEAGAGICAAAFAALASARAFGRGSGAGGYRAVPWGRYSLAVLRRTVLETGLVLAGTVSALARGRPLRGAFIRIPFETGGDGPEDRVRRAGVVWGMAISPNDYVAAFGEREGLLVHRLIAQGQAPGAGEKRWPA
jgi:hypothetical protein